MTKIKYVDDNKDGKLKVGDFVSLPGSDFCIINDDYAVVDLESGETLTSSYDTLDELTIDLNIKRITKPFTIYPESEDSDD